MSDGLWGLALGIVGVLAAPYLGISAAVGWLVGSTIGSYIDLQGMNSNKVLEGHRVTDFKGVSSKYGIGIARGYGTVRMGGNMIWVGDILEILETTQHCIKIPGPYGLGSAKQCTTTQRYRYFQSGAIAFGEGPACDITRLWADGKLVYDIRPVLPGVGLDIGEKTKPASIASLRGDISPCHPSDELPFRIYLGTQTQPIDATIAEVLGAANTVSGQEEAYAFRNIVYVMMSNIELEPFGYRLPTLSAEIVFADCDEPYASHQPESPVQVLDNGGTGFVGYEAMGKVRGHPELYWGYQDITNKARVLGNLRTHQILFEDTMEDSPFVPQLFYSNQTDKNEMSPDFNVVTAYFTFNTYIEGVADFFTGRLGYFTPYEGPISLSLGRVGPQRYDSVRDAFWVGHSIGPAITFMPNHGPPSYLENGAQGEFQVPEGLGIINNEFSAPFSDYEALNHGVYYPMLALNNGHICVAVEIDNDCEIWVAHFDFGSLLTNWVHKIDKDMHLAGTGPQKLGVEVFYNDGVSLQGLRNMAYDPTTDSFLFGDFFGSLVVPPRAHDQSLFKVSREDLQTAYDSGSNQLFLPPEVPDNGLYIPDIATIDDAAFHHNIWNGYFHCTHGANQPIFIDIRTMTVGPEELARYHKVNAGSFGVSNTGTWQYRTMFYPHLKASLPTSTATVWWTNPPTAVLLSEIVTDLLTRSDGDPRIRLTPSDLDVSELTDLVKGFYIYQQSSIRSSLEILQQTYQFDVVESDGIIKFPKRPKTPTFSITESELAAHQFESSKDERYEPLVYESTSRVELPQELSVAYTDFDLDYNQGIQRARYSSGQEEKNTTITLTVVLDKDEAAQIADILLNEAHITRIGQYLFKLNSGYLNLDPSDVGTVTMDDGTAHTIRLTGVTIGANGVVECLGVKDFAALYSSDAVGVGGLLEEASVPSEELEPIVFDISARPLYAHKSVNQHGLVGGVGALGDPCVGGCLYTVSPGNSKLLAGCSGLQGCVTWGYVVNSIGHTDPVLASNVQDTETVFRLNVIGGPIPTSATLAEALAGQSLLVVGDEIIGYTDILRPFDVGVTGTDIEGDGVLNQIRSTGPTNFLALGFQPGDAIRLQKELTQPGYDTPYRVKVYVIDDNPGAVTANTIQLTNDGIPVGQLFNYSWPAGENVILNGGSSNIIELSNTLRGLFGTENNRHHPEGAKFMFLNNAAFFAPVNAPESLGDAVSAYARAEGEQSQRTHFTTIAYNAVNLMPWAPGDVQHTGDAFTWQRRDKEYTDGIIPSPPPLNEEFESSELVELYEIVKRDGCTPGSENDVIYEDSVDIPEATIPLGTGPELVEIYQMSDEVGRGHRHREIYIGSGLLTGGGRISTDYTPTIIKRWNAHVLSGNITPIPIDSPPDGGGGDPFAGTPAIEMFANDALRLAGYSIKEACPCMDMETLCIVVPPRKDSFFVNHGTFIRGGGEDHSFAPTGNDLSTLGFFGGLAKGYDVVQLEQRLGVDSYVNLGSAPLDWEVPIFDNYTRAFAVRVRVYKHRIYLNAWEVSDPTDPTSSPEPAGWLVENYDARSGPFFGAAGVFTGRGGSNEASATKTYCTYFSWAHKGGTAP